MHQECQTATETAPETHDSSRVKEIGLVTPLVSKQMLPGQCSHGAHQCALKNACHFGSLGRPRSCKAQARPLRRF